MNSETPSAPAISVPGKSVPGVRKPSGKSAQGVEAVKKIAVPGKSAQGTEPKLSAPDRSAPGVSNPGKSAPGTTSKLFQKSTWWLVLGGVLAALVLGGGAWALAAKLKARPARPAVELTPEERELVELTNTFRIENGLAPLAVDPALCAVARSISTERAERGPHYILNKEALDAQLRAAGYSCDAFGLGGINVKSVRPLDSTLGKMTMDSHAQKRVLDPAYNEVGIAIHYYAPQGMYYVTQVFAARSAR